MKNKIASALIYLFLFVVPAFAEEINAQKLLEQVDDNLWANTKFISGRLIIDNGRKVRTLTQDSWMEGVDRSYSHYKSPAREKGTKMLKIGGQLWMYTPRTDRKILIAGHLLRQSMMGSDLSYEDMMEKSIVATRQLAKRQFTWLRSWDNIEWFDVNHNNLSDLLLKSLEDDK